MISTETFAKFAKIAECFSLSPEESREILSLIETVGKRFEGFWARLGEAEQARFKKLAWYWIGKSAFTKDKNAAIEGFITQFLSGRKKNG